MKKAIRMGDILHPADAATAFGDAQPRAIEGPVGMFGGQGDAGDHPPFDCVNIDRKDLVDPLDHALAERETEGVIPQIGRRRHHDRIADSAYLDRDGHLDRNAAPQFGIARIGQADPAHRKFDGP